MINFLVASLRVMILSTDRDEDIESEFDGWVPILLAQGDRVTASEVQIEAVPQ